jgi:GAF domain-containing protein/anti-sigma regulatory factor (Ser/Thr protein kinase)
VAFAFLSLLALIAWRSEVVRQDANADVRADVLVRRVAQSIETTVRDDAFRLRRLVNRGRRLKLDPEHFRRNIDNGLPHGRDFPTAAYVDDSGIVKAVDSDDGVLKLSEDLSRDDRWAYLLEAAREHPSLTLSPAELGSDGRAFSRFSTAIALLNNKPEYVGSIVGIVSLSDLIRDAIVNDDERGSFLEVWDGSVRLYSSGEPLDGRRARTTTRSSSTGRPWEVRATVPLTPFGRPQTSPKAILIVGLSTAALLAYLLYQFLRQRERRATADRLHLQALTSLNDITGVISSRLAGQQDLLDYLAKSACKLLDCDRACVLLHNAEQHELRVMASINFPTTQVGQVLPVEDSPSCEKALSTGEIVVANDLADPSRTGSGSVIERGDARSMLFIPMYAQSNRVGLLLAGSKKRMTFSDEIIRLAGLLGSQVAVTITNNQLYEQVTEALRAQQRLQQQREKLTAITLAVYQASSLPESLKRLVELAPAALEMDLCVVSLINETGDALYRAAVTAPYDSLIGGRFAIAGCNAETVLRNREMLVINDGARDPLIHPDLKRSVRVGSIIYCPLFESSGKPLGLLQLIRHTAGRFSEDHVRLSRVFASRAAGAIEAARLYQQTRRDADTKAMLLRELNHRVKNNLAGIVGLLAARPPDVVFPAAVRQWLDRLIDRINIMGRAHELFVGGPQTVGLAELIDQLLPTQSIVKPSGVRIVKQLDAISITLSTERAVALAMVLHELCCNAIAHGLGEQGTITIRARSQTQDQMIIEVADDGVGIVAPLENAVVGAASRKALLGIGDSIEVANRGWGLRLVEGLVARELRGRFSMRRSGVEGGGTVAVVEFPVAAEQNGSRNP